MRQHLIREKTPPVRRVPLPFGDDGGRARWPHVLDTGGIHRFDWLSAICSFLTRELLLEKPDFARRPSMVYILEKITTRHKRLINNR